MKAHSKVEAKRVRKQKQSVLKIFQAVVFSSRRAPYTCRYFWTISVFPLGWTDVLSSWRLSHLVVYLVFIHAVARSHEVIPSALYSIRNWFTYSWNRRWYHAFITQGGGEGGGNKHRGNKIQPRKKKRIKLITRNGLPYSNFICMDFKIQSQLPFGGS